MHCAANLLFKPYRIALILLLAGLSTAWTCSAVVNLNGCPRRHVAPADWRPIAQSDLCEHGFRSVERGRNGLWSAI